MLLIKTLEVDPEFQRAIATQQGRSKRPPTTGQQGGMTFRNLKTGVSVEMNYHFRTYMSSIN